MNKAKHIHFRGFELKTNFPANYIIISQFYTPNV